MPENLRAAEDHRGRAIERLEYPESPGAVFVPSWTGWEEAPDAATGLGGSAQRAGAIAGRGDGAELEKRLAEETCRSFEAGRARGIDEGRRAEREREAEARAAAESRRAGQTAAMLEAWAAERARYFESVEAEVVKLALAIAARILRREASSDPLLLVGAVRAALGQVSAATEVRLLVPGAELELWREAVALLPNLALRPEVLAGEGMQLGECRMETSLGNADLGLRAQLAEVERALLESGGARGLPAAQELRAPASPADAGSAA